MVIDFKKTAPNDDSIALEKLLDEGKIDLSKDEIHELIEKRASQLREDGETVEQAYSKFITANPAGRVLFKAYQVASGLRKVAGASRAEVRELEIPRKPRIASGWSETKAPKDAEQDFVPRMAEPDEDDETPEERLDRMTRRRMREHPGESYEKAFTEEFIKASAATRSQIRENGLRKAMGHRGY